MGITIQPRNDISYLFSGLGNNGSNNRTSGNDFLIQYASIKNGSYAKLLKAYYSETGNDAVKSVAKKSTSMTSEDTKNIAEVQSATDSLKESADALFEKGSKSVFAKKDIVTKDKNGVETTTKGFDVDAIYKAVNSFVKDYNDVIDAVNNVQTGSIINRTTSMVNASIANVNMLNKIGITINDDSTLSIDEKTFKQADMNTVKSMFNDTGSYGYSVSAQSSLINFSADQAASKAATYTGNGTYNSVYNTGNIFNTYF
uniref:hypothetical protein n=1 Tax=Acetatifactor sp. TaxID=1872090 RepID=UPI004055BDEF